ncbi:RNA polymerase recycling motor HelD [Heyndrickxia coagulans]|uniref:RNA polymerase recycling motor HelD n=1 Tax=Heyndrickxia coagulans TaxID=1398 RepID=UPI002235EB56|nr:RNA polymerase recycling motor HelD [Heyndrickxia coagulans]UZH05067.1 UvrD-helicase domain-containing protein [Heyndrickxia coagulans]
MPHDEEWLKEQKRVDYTIEKMKQEKETLLSKVRAVRGEAQEIRNTFWEDVTVNLDEPDDVVETSASVRQQAELLAERERSYGHMEKDVKKLDRLIYSPYFARVDFHEEGEPSEPIYIGIASYRDEDEYLVYDWRAPISSIYYDGVPGPVSYQAPDGRREGIMDLKRQFLIRRGHIEAMFDTGISIGDEMLQEMLGANANTHMKNIVATIQKEQNRIIRDVSSNLLFVQGAAGSGKTSVALQRIAYLLYRYRDSLHSEQIVLFSPNQLFNHYVSKVLPELGENNMQQTTFLEFAQARAGKKLKVESLLEQMEEALEGKAENRKEAQIKGSLAFFHAVRDYAEKLLNGGIIFRDIRFKGETIVPKEKIAEMFYAYDKSYSLPNRFQLVSKKLLKELQHIAKEERKKPWVEEEMELLGTEAYLAAHQYAERKSRKNNDAFSGADDEKEFLARKIVNRRFSSIRKQIKAFHYFHIRAQYLDFLRRAPEFVPGAGERLDGKTRAAFREGWLPYEDTVPFLYLFDLLTGKATSSSIKYVFIDEIQDYSPIQLAYLRYLFPYSKFTMLGDLNQSIFGTSGRSQMELIKEIFGEEKAQVVYLTKSYRSTAQITRFTKEILAGGEKIEWFEREGDLPVVAAARGKEEALAKVVQFAKKYAKDSHTVAIIGKSRKQCAEAYETLRKELDLAFIEKEYSDLPEGIILIPSYLAKGLEFDSVIVLDASASVYKDEAERTLLYTVGTRAMHHLALVSNGPVTPLLDKVPETLYVKE